jgi:raffinose/stachyose/melibiose transport system permease protein
MARGEPRRRSTLAQIWQKRQVYLFLVPTFALLVTFRYYPAFSALYHSLFNWNGAQINVFIGLANYAELLRDPVIHISARNMLIFVTAGLALSLIPPLIAAELIFSLSSGRLQYFFRVLFVIPMVVPTMVTLLIWRFLYNPIFGLFNQILGLFGIPPQIWLASPQLAIWSIIFIGFPWVSGFSLLVYLAGLQAIPQEVWDAVKMDGAVGLNRFFRVDLPLILAQVRVLTILAILGAIQNFGTVLVLTNGGPGYATMVPGLRMYLVGFETGRMGYATAIGTAMFVLILSFTYLNMRYVRSSVEFQA